MSEKWGDWWFKTGHSTYEEHSVEKQFGSEPFAFLKAA